MYIKQDGITLCMYFIGGVEKTNSDKSVCKGFANYKAKAVVSGFEESSKWGD